MDLRQNMACILISVKSLRDDSIVGSPLEVELKHYVSQNLLQLRVAI